MIDLNKKVFIRKLYEAYERAGFNVNRGFLSFLSKRFNVTPQAVNEWIHPEKNYPKLKVLFNISYQTGMSLDELIKGESSSFHENKQNKIPVYSLNDFKNFDPIIPISQQEIVVLKEIPSLSNCVDGLFGITQKGESMERESGISFPENIILVFNMNKRNPKNNDYVLAQLPDKTILFRLYVNEGNEYLMPLNKRFRNYEGSFKILGCLEYSISFFDKDITF